MKSNLILICVLHVFICLVACRPFVNTEQRKLALIVLDGKKDCNIINSNQGMNFFNVNLCESYIPPFRENYFIQRKYLACFGIYDALYNLCDFDLNEVYLHVPKEFKNASAFCKTASSIYSKLNLPHKAEDNKNWNKALTNVMTDGELCKNLCIVKDLVDEKCLIMISAANEYLRLKGKSLKTAKGTPALLPDNNKNANELSIENENLLGQSVPQSNLPSSPENLAIHENPQEHSEKKAVVAVGTTTQTGIIGLKNDKLDPMNSHGGVLPKANEPASDPTSLKTTVALKGTNEKKTLTPAIAQSDTVQGYIKNELPLDQNKVESTPLPTAVGQDKKISNEPAVKNEKDKKKVNEPDQKMSNEPAHKNTDELDQKSVIDPDQKSVIDPDQKSVIDPDQKLTEEQDQEQFSDNVGDSDAAVLEPNDDKRANLPSDSPVVISKNAEVLNPELQQVSEIQLKDNFVETEDSYTFSYFVTVAILCFVAYFLFHYKNKLFALALEGRKSRNSRGRGRPSSANYSRLHSNLQEAITSNVSTPSATHVLY